jgi:hypothetical protein
MLDVRTAREYFRYIAPSIEDVLEDVVMMSSISTREELEKNVIIALPGEYKNNALILFSEESKIFE